MPAVPLRRALEAPLRDRAAQSDLAKNLEKISAVLGARVRSKTLIYRGDEPQTRSSWSAVPWLHVDDWLRTAAA